MLLLSLPIELVKRGGAEPNALSKRIAADFIQREQAVMDEERGVFHSLGHHGSAELLPARQEIEPGVAIRDWLRWRIQQEHAAKEVEDGFRDFVRDGRAMRQPNGLAQIGSVSPGKLEIADITSVNGQTRRDFLQCADQFAHGQVAAARIQRSEAPQAEGEHADIGAEEVFHDLALADVPGVRKGRMDSRKVAVYFVQLVPTMRVDEQRVHRVQEIVAGGAGGSPILRELFVSGNDLFDNGVNVQGVAVVVRLDLPRVLEPVKIFKGIEQAVNVVHAKAIDLVFGNQSKDKSMSGREDLRVLHSDGNQIVQPKEAAVIDFPRRRAPMGQTEVLSDQKSIQRFERLRISRHAVKNAQHLIESSPDLTLSDV